MAKKVVLIGVPMDCGANKRGAAGGPAAIRRTELQKSLESLDYTVEDRGDIRVPKGNPAVGNRKMKYAQVIRKVCEALAKETHAAVRDGAVPITLGGDHSLAMGSAAGVARFFHEKKRPLGLLWMDAHGDINVPETSLSGNIHGMPMAHLLGMGDKGFSHLAGFAPAFDAKRTCLVGVRDLDAGEKSNLRHSGIRVFTMADIDRLGMARVAEEATEIAGPESDAFHLSFDIDAADPSIAQGVGTPKRGGLTYREAHLLMEIIAESGRLASMDMVEVNPLEDSHNTTAELASELILSAMGKKIF